MTKICAALSVKGVLVGIASMFATVLAFGQSLTWLGTWGSGAYYYAEAHGVSADGTVVVGWGGVYSPHVAFRWTLGTGMQNMGQLVSGRDAEAWGMSDDGRVIVGYGMISSSAYRGFRWVNGVFTQFSTFGGSTSQAYAASANGSVIVGAAALSSGLNRAFRWTEEGMVNLGTLPGGIRSVARGVSADGSVVVGWSGDASFIHHAFRWVNGVMTDIHNPAFGQSEALGVSGDGNVVVGAWGGPSFTPALPFRWTQATGMVNLGTLGGQWGEAWDANYDGSIVVGWSDRDPRDTSEWAAFRWTVSGGMEDLNVTYASLLRPGDRLEWASAISPDGRYIVGNGRNSATGKTEVFLLDTWRWGDTNGNGCIDDSDLLNVLFAFGTPGTGLTRHEDINKDGIVDDADLLIVLFNFGQGC
jgi:probable HAF family extracellular repeat protein